MASNSSVIMSDGGNISAATDRVRMNDETTPVPNDCDYGNANARVMIGTDMNAIDVVDDDNGMGADPAIDNKMYLVNQKKRKQKIDPIVGAEGGNDDCCIDVMYEYEIVERDAKRQKIEVERKLDNCMDAIDDDDDDGGETVVGEPTVDKRKRSVKPALPPKPKNLMLRDPTNGLINAKLKTKLENNHAAAIQKLNAHAEQLRQENNRLRNALSNERIAVRTLK